MGNRDRSQGNSETKQEEKVLGRQQGSSHRLLLAGLTALELVLWRVRDAAGCAALASATGWAGWRGWASELWPPGGQEKQLSTAGKPRHPPVLAQPGLLSPAFPPAAGSGQLFPMELDGSSQPSDGNLSKARGRGHGMRILHPGIHPGSSLPGLPPCLFCLLQASPSLPPPNIFISDVDSGIQAPSACLQVAPR